MTELLTPNTVKNLNVEIEQGGNLYWPSGVIATQMAITGPPVARNTAYALGDRVTPLTPNGFAYECITAGTSHASNEPAFFPLVGSAVADGSVLWQCVGTTTNRDYLVDTTGYTAIMTVRQGDYEGAIQLECSTADGRITVGFTPPKWQASTIYGVGQQVVPTLLNGFVYSVVVAGTSDASQPIWPIVLGTTVLNGTVRWRCEQAESLGNGLVNNLVVNAGPDITAALTAWGRGLYTLKLIDTFGNIALWADGLIYLRQEATE